MDENPINPINPTPSDQPAPSGQPVMGQPQPTATQLPSEGGPVAAESCSTCGGPSTNGNCMNCSQPNETCACPPTQSGGPMGGGPSAPPAV